MSGFGYEVGGLAVAIVGAWVIPAVGMRAVAPSLESSRLVVPNYRGRVVFLGLGIVWVFWAIGISFAWILMASFGGVGGSPPQWTPVYVVLLAFIFGLVDDVFGTHGEKGFRGHLRAMAEGRLTTGGLKLVGIGAAAVWAAAISMLTMSQQANWSLPEQVLGFVTGTILIAGSANLLNLLDLRPGRALKGYLVLVAVAWAFGAAAADWRGQPAVAATNLLAVAVWFVGPALAVWGYDLSERGILGDAGANAAGALAGYALLVALPLWGVVVAAVLVVGLNLASERVSFSQVIEGSRFLSWLDGLSRLQSKDRPA